MADSETAALLSTLLTSSVLSFGTYTLKSGRQSPYFLNSSLLHTVPSVLSTASAYASALTTPPFTSPTTGAPIYDVLFGPAYKGIPLVAAIMTELGHRAASSSADFSNISYSFNRKEAKPHGEGGIIVGSPLKSKRVVIIDDVITSGKAMREAVSIIKSEGGTLVGVVLLMDRQERASEDEERSTVAIARDEYDVPVVAVLRLEDVIKVLEEGGVAGVGPGEVERLKEYRGRYAGKE